MIHLDLYHDTGRIYQKPPTFLGSLKGGARCGENREGVHKATGFEVKQGVRDQSVANSVQALQG